jgi:hypothetical protein
MELRTFLAAAAALVLLLALAAAALVLRNPGKTRRRVLEAFRRPEPSAQPPAPHHYYRPYWS